MLFFVRFDVTQPANVSNDELIATWCREAEAAIGAMDAGAVPHLWKVAGQRVVLGVIDVPTAEDLDRALGGLPIIREMGAGHEDRGLADLRLPHVRRGPQRRRARGRRLGLSGAAGSAAAALILRCGPAALALALGAPALGFQPPRTRGLRRLRRSPHARDLERPREAYSQPFERERAVARLAARVLRDGAHDRPAARRDPRLLGVVQGRGRSDVEARLDPRLGLVGVLASGPRRAARQQDDLVERDRDVAVDRQELGHAHMMPRSPGRGILERCAHADGRSPLVSRCA